MNIKEKLEDLFDNINKEEKKEKDKTNYIKILNLINNFRENIVKENKKRKNTTNNEIVNDVNDSLKIISNAYQNKIKDKFFIDKEKMIAKFYMKKNAMTKSIIDDKMVEINNKGEEIEENIQVYELPIIKEINEECDKIQNILMDNESKEENKNIEKLKNDILQIKGEINKLKVIDKTVIERLNEQINAIRKESDKLQKVLKVLQKENFH